MGFEPIHTLEVVLNGAGLPWPLAGERVGDQKAICYPIERVMVVVADPPLAVRNELGARGWRLVVTAGMNDATAIAAVRQALGAWLCRQTLQARALYELTMGDPGGIFEYDSDYLCLYCSGREMTRETVVHDATCPILLGRGLLTQEERLRSQRPPAPSQNFYVRILRRLGHSVEADRLAYLVSQHSQRTKLRHRKRRKTATPADLRRLDELAVEIPTLEVELAGEVSNATD